MDFPTYYRGYLLQRLPVKVQRKRLLLTTVSKRRSPLTSMSSTGDFSQDSMR